MRYHVFTTTVVVASATLLSASACAGNRLSDPGPGQRVAATLPQNAYLSGRVVDVTVQNLSDIRLQYPLGFCKIELQQQQGDEWVTVRSPEGCRLALAFLDPRQAVVQEYQLPVDIPSGTYRLSMPMPVPQNSPDPEPRLTTAAFRVGSTAL